jgi:hypothetical protein
LTRPASRSPDSSKFVFATARGGEMSADNFRSRVLGKPATVKDGKDKPGTGAVGAANRRLEGGGPATLARQADAALAAAHVLLAALRARRGPGTVMDEMGHTDPALALRVYRQAMQRSEQEREQLRTLVEGAPVGPTVGQREEVAADGPSVEVGE